MAEIATIARPYAEAVFELAAEKGRLADWSAALGALAGVMHNPDMAAYASNPKVSSDSLVETVMSAAPTLANDAEAKNFVGALVANERLSLLPMIATQFETLRAEREGYADADVASAFPIADAELAKLVALLERKFKRKIRPHVRIDRELIGGVVVRVGDEVIDSSVRSRLARMQAALQS